MLLPWLCAFDFFNARANYFKPFNSHRPHKKWYDFAILVPIFNDLKYLSNIDFLKQYRSKVVLCTTTHENRAFYEQLTALAGQHHFRIIYSDVKLNHKNPWSIYNKTLLAHDAVLKDGLSKLVEKYIIFLDGDTVVDGDLQMLCGAMVEKKYDLASVKILPLNKKNWLEKLQAVEYDIAMQARLIYPWLTSGAGMIAKREVLTLIMKNHSLFFNGGDIEIGKLADMMGYRIGHLPMVFKTAIPQTSVQWIKQRTSWMCGCFRHAIINLNVNARYPFHFIYFSFIIFCLLPFKFIEIINRPQLVIITFGLYVVLTYLANWRVRSKWMIIFPFYALFQILIMPWLGIAKYIKSAWLCRNAGLIKLKVINKNKIKAYQSQQLIFNKNIVFSVFVLLIILIGLNFELVANLFFGIDIYRHTASLFDKFRTIVF